ncbi:MAG: rhamnulokinase [Actinobacteria bacterium]|jgi:rhamnulokinase|nr:rhamnulokinase [Actinomycetota bacterium]
MPVSFVAVDLGGQSGRVVLGTFTADGFRLDEVRRFANLPVLIDGVLCWDAEALFGDTIEGIREALLRAAALESEVAGIAVDSWGVDYGLVDDGGGLVSPVRHYRASESRFVAWAGERVSSAEAFSRTGIAEMPINTCFQLIRDAQGGLLAGRPTALLTPDLWTFWLTGTRGAERTIASTTGLLDRRTGDWSAELLDRWGIPPETLPELVETGTRAGQTTTAITERIGAGSPVPVYRAPAHDTASAFAAVAAPDERSAVISCGTWALVGCLTAGPILTEDARRADFTNEVGAEGSNILMRNLSGTWLLEECLRTWSETDDGDTAVATLREELIAEAAALDSSALSATIDPGAPELIERGDMPARIGALYVRASGESRTLPRVEIVRLILESLAASFADTIRTASSLGDRDLADVRMIGGGSRIDLLVRLTEQATGLPVHVGHPEATSIGNICVQAAASGAFPDLRSARLATGMLVGAPPRRQGRMHT